MSKLDETTLKAIAAIILRVPMSGTKWLDHMIEVSRLEEVAKCFLQGIIAYEGISIESITNDVDRAYKIANSLIKSR